MKEFFNIRRDRANRSRTQIITIVVCLMLAMAIAIGGTVAWVIDTTTQVTDTFTYGLVDIELTEGKGNALWTKAANGQIADDTTLKLLPGETYTFNPYVKVVSKSESAYVFVSVIDENNVINYAPYAIADGWTLVNGTTNVYYRTYTSVENDTYYGVISGDVLTVKNTLGVLDLAAIGSAYPTLTIKAYAIQSANLGDADEPAEIWNLVKDSNAVYTAP